MLQDQKWKFHGFDRYISKFGQSSISAIIPDPSLWHVDLQDAKREFALKSAAIDAKQMAEVSLISGIPGLDEEESYWKQYEVNLNSLPDQIAEFKRKGESGMGFHKEKKIKSSSDDDEDDNYWNEY